MRRSQHDIDMTIVEIIRYGGLSYIEAETILENTLTESQRYELCKALEAWETSNVRCGECGVSFIECGVERSEDRPLLCTECSQLAMAGAA